MADNNSRQEQSNQDDQPISLYQSHAILFTTVLGVGALSFQRGLAAASKQDAIWVLLIGGLIFLAEVWLATRLMQMFPRKTLVHFSEGLFATRKRLWWGKVPAILFYAVFAAYWLGGTALVSRTYGETLSTAVLPRTPMEFTLAVLILAGATVACNRPQVIARFNEFLVPVLYLPIPLFLVAALQRGELTNLLPLLQTDWQGIVKGIASSVFAFSGVSVVLIFMAYYQQPEKAMRAHGSAGGVLVFLYWGLLATTLAVFGPYELIHFVWPTLDLVKTAEVPGIILERVEAAVIAIWVVAVFTTMVNFYAAWTEMVVSVFRLEDRWRKWITWGTAPFVFFLARWPEDLQDVFTWSDRLGLYEVLAIFVLVPLLMLIGKVRGKGGKTDGEKAASKA